MLERRYSEADVAAIFQGATETLAPQRSAFVWTEGMTLAQLQEICRPIGLSIHMGRTVGLYRSISEREWEQMIVDLRESSVSGRTATLEALLAPTPSGIRLRLKPFNADASAFMASVWRRRSRRGDADRRPDQWRGEPGHDVVSRYGRDRGGDSPLGRCTFRVGRRRAAASSKRPFPASQGRTCGIASGEAQT